MVSAGGTRRRRSGEDVRSRVAGVTGGRIGRVRACACVCGCVRVCMKECVRVSESGT